MSKGNATMRLFLLSVGMCAILGGAVHVSGAEGDKGGRHPLGLNENHPYGRLTSEYVTPHVAWGNPYYAGKLRALVLAPIWSQRETVELAQRLSLDYTPWMTQTFMEIVSPASADPAGRFFQPPPSVVNRVLREALQKDYDVIVIGKLNWAMLPGKQRLQLLEKVAAGTGLVYINPPQPHKELEIVSEEQRRRRGRHVHPGRRAAGAVARIARDPRRKTPQDGAVWKRAGRGAGLRRESAHGEICGRHLRGVAVFDPVLGYDQLYERQPTVPPRWTSCRKCNGCRTNITSRWWPRPSCGRRARTRRFRFRRIFPPVWRGPWGAKRWRSPRPTRPENVVLRGNRARPLRSRPGFPIIHQGTPSRRSNLCAGGVALRRIFPRRLGTVARRQSHANLEQQVLHRDRRVRFRRSFP